MTDEKERSARNKHLIARMAAAPTRAQMLAELELEISDAIDCAVAEPNHRASLSVPRRILD